MEVAGIVITGKCHGSVGESAYLFTKLCVARHRATLLFVEMRSYLTA